MSDSDVAEVWALNEAGDIPEAAKDHVTLQAGIVSNASVSTTNVSGVIAELPNGARLEGFHSVNMSVAGNELDDPLTSVNLHWRADSRKQLGETGEEIAVALQMDPDDVARWAAGPGGSTIAEGQANDDVQGLAEVTLTYRDIGTDSETLIVSLFWPRFFQS